MTAYETRMESLEPAFREKVKELIKRAEEVTSRRWVITDGRRTMAQQRVLYAQGRTKPGKVVTNAKPGSSAHNYGLAADLAPLVDGDNKIDWNASHKVFKAMADEAVKLGLVSGYYFKTIFDAPHVEEPDWRKQKALWLDGKLAVP